MTTQHPFRHLRLTVVMITMLLVAAVGAPVSLAAGPVGNGTAAGPAAPAWYYLTGDNTNSGSAITYFNTTSGSTGGGWRFTDNTSSATTVYATCPNGGACWGGEFVGTSIGVYGYSTASGNGVYGYSGGNGVYGYGYGASSTGVYGGSSQRYGVWGNAYGGGVGVYATSTTTGTAVYGSGGYYGLYATAASNGSGVYAYGGSYGVIGSASSNGTGLYGYGSYGLRAYGGPYGTYSSGTSYGVYATTDSGKGVYGYANSGNGVYAYSVSGGALVAAAPRGTAVRAASTSSYGLYATTTSGTGGYIATSTGAVGLRVKNATTGAGYYALVTEGDVLISGNYSATGTKSARVATSQGARLMYAAESTQNIFTDQGSAQLVNGRAVINIDSLYAQTVSLNNPYQVFLTPNSADTPGLAVVSKTATSFEVRELKGGTGTYRFDWRIDALRKGYEKDRMAPAPTLPVQTAVQEPDLMAAPASANPPAPLTGTPAHAPTGAPPPADSVPSKTK